MSSICTIIFSPSKALCSRRVASHSFSWHPALPVCTLGFAHVCSPPTHVLDSGDIYEDGQMAVNSLQCQWAHKGSLLLASFGLALILWQSRALLPGFTVDKVAHSRLKVCCSIPSVSVSKRVVYHIQRMFQTTLNMQAIGATQP